MAEYLDTVGTLRKPYPHLAEKEKSITNSEKELIKLIHDSKDPEAAILKAATIIAMFIGGNDEERSSG